MRSLLNAKTITLADAPKGTLFAIKRYGESGMLGIMLTESGVGDGGSCTILLLNPESGQSEGPQWHRLFAWPADQECVSFGTGWKVEPLLSLDSLSTFGDPTDNSKIAIGPDGVYFRAAQGGGHRNSYRTYISADTLEQVSGLGDRSFHLPGYRIFLSEDDARHGRPPIFQIGTSTD